MKINTSLVLVAVAVAVLAVAVGRPLLEHLAPWRTAAQAQATDPAARARAEEAARRAEFARDPEAVRARMRALQQQGDHAAAMAFGALYYSLADTAMNAMYGESTDAVSRRQRLDEYRGLMAANCIEEKARGVVAKEHALDTVSGASRLDAVAARAAVTAYLREIAAHPPARDDDREHDHEAHGAGPPRIHADFRAALDAPAGTDGDLLCVWRIAGDTGKGNKRASGSADVWLAPAASGHGVEGAVISRRP